MKFAESQNIEGMTIKPIEDEGRSPYLIIDVAGMKSETVDDDRSKGCVLFYGHMDK